MRKSLTPKERVLTALQHEEPDRLPVVIGISNATGIKIQAYRRLKAVLNLNTPERYLYDWPELGTAAPEEVLLQRLHCDVRGVYDRMPRLVEERNRKRAPHSPYFDDWGIGQKETSPENWFPAIHPLAKAETLDALEHYPWPDMQDAYRYTAAAERARQLHEEGRYAILGVPWLMFPLERAFALQGLERFLYNLVKNTDFALALLQKTTALCKTFMRNFLHATGKYLDIIKVGDDLGMQDRLLFSPKMYRNLIKPFHSDYLAFIKQHTSAKIFFHTDGDVFDVLDDLVEIGVEVLNPIQTSAGKMANLVELKRRYGKKLSFCGGIDTQRVLPLGTSEEVRQEVKRVIQALAPGGGYMLAAVHTIPAETPPQNILAMVDAALEFGQYPIL